ncbi:cell division protein FtsB [Methylophilaceae bacterium]|nr:cell division protein FtsB [Methylophilaceae bacterium]
MNKLTLIFFLLIILIQYPLWLADGGFLNIVEKNKQIKLQQKINSILKKENGALIAEVNDLKKGTKAIEERARGELNMIKKGEIFFQIINKKK